MSLLNFLNDEEKKAVEEAEKDNFFTVGYEGKTLLTFIATLKKNGVKTLIDVRGTAYSQNPDFSKGRLQAALERNGITYIHWPKYGIPSDIRKSGHGIEWYKEHVVPNISPEVLKTITDQPACFMCMEADVKHCHRRFILQALTQKGLRGRDIS